MDFCITIAEFQKALKVLGAVAKVNEDDVTGHILIDVSANGRVVFVASDSKLHLTHLTEGCNVSTEGRVCVSFNQLNQFIGSFSAWDEESGVKEVYLKKLKTNISVKLSNTFIGGKEISSKSTLRSYPPDKIYVPPPFKEPSFSIPTAVLKFAISKVAYAINPISPRVFIQGMNMVFDEENIYFAGTDALKLSEYRAKNTGKLQKGSIVVPFTFMTALRKIIEADTQVFFEIKDSKICAVVNNTTLHGNLIVGEEYPKYASAFDGFTDSIVINKEVMLSGFVPFLNALSNEDHKRLTIEISDKRLKMYSDNSESEYNDDIEFSGKFLIDINGSFLAQTLNSIKDDIIELKFSDENGVLMFDSENFHNQRSLITPIKRRG